MPDDLHFPPLYGISQRQPPANIMAEEMLLGALLANNKALERCAGLEPDHFADACLGAVFAAIREGINAGRHVDAVSLKGRFDQALLAHLAGSMVGVPNATEYSRVIRETWVHRQIIELGEAAVNGAFGALPPAELIAMIGQSIDRLSLGQTSSPVTMLDAAMDSALVAMEKAAAGVSGGISSGFGCIDVRLGGLEPGLVYVIAGRPGMGKSALGHQIALNAARNGVGVLELSLEMSAQQLGRRTLATAAAVPIIAIKRGDLRHADRLVGARKELAGLPLAIDDAGGQTAAQIAAKARAHKRKHGLGLIMVDHLNLMRADDADAKHGGTWAVERASATMLQLAKDSECPVLLLAQLNRGVEGREDKRPGLSDLRQAGAIEQDAYAVGFVYRPEYYLGGEPEPKAGLAPARLATMQQDWLDQKEAVAGRAELIWSKVRDGEPGTDRLTFHGPTATFGEGGQNG
jgi:replicative DNA helicase